MLNVDRLLAAGTIEGPFKTARPVRRGCFGRAVRVVLRALGRGGRVL